jgi:soluble cytochrome b562
MSTPRRFRALIRLKLRRLDQLTKLHTAASAALAHCVKAELIARAREHDCQRAQALHEQKITAMTGSVRFRADNMVTMSLIADSLAVDSCAARRTTQEACNATAGAQEEVQQALKAVRRAQQQRDQLQQRLDRLIAELDAASEDLQDEDAEEAVAARLIAQVRAAVPTWE